MWGNWWICPRSRKWNQVFKLVRVSESRSVVSNSLWSHRPYGPRNSPGQNTGVGSLSLFRGIFLTQGLHPGLLHCRLILYELSHKGSPRILERVAYPFSSRSSQPRNQSGYPALQADSLTTELSRKLLNIVLYCLSFFFFLTFYFVLGFSWLTNDIVIVSGEQWRDSVTHIHGIHSPPNFPPI